MTREEIIKALEGLKQICVEHRLDKDPRGCGGCPLGNSNDSCRIADMPDNWKINDSPETIWRALD